MTVRVLLCFETSDWASLRLYRQRLYGSILLVRTLKTVIRRLRGSAPGSSLRCIDGGQQDHLRGCEAEARSIGRISLRSEPRRPELRLL